MAKTVSITAKRIEVLAALGRVNANCTTTRAMAAALGRKTIMLERTVFELADGGLVKTYFDLDKVRCVELTKKGLAVVEAMKAPAERNPKRRHIDNMAAILRGEL